MAFCIGSDNSRKRNPEAIMAGNQTNSNGRGGARKGAGRPKGALTSRTREIAEKAAGQGITPLEFMLEMMRRESFHEDPKIEAQREVMRFEAAKAAAPYIHPRLSSVEVDADVKVRSLAQELAELNAAAD